jgi:hypothetical protein
MWQKQWLPSRTHKGIDLVLRLLTWPFSPGGITTPDKKKGRPHERIDDGKMEK